MKLKARSVIDLIRHGEPAGGPKYRGQTDDPLSVGGWQQMWDALASESVTWDLIVSSPLSRCLEFAQELQQQNNTPLIVEERFIEMGFGEWEGKTKNEIDAQALQQFYKDPDLHAPPGAEHLRDFYKRIIEAWEELIDKQRNKAILLVGHSCVIRGIITHAEKQEGPELFKIAIPYANISRLEIDYKPRRPVSNLIAVRHNLS